MARTARLLNRRTSLPLASLTQTGGRERRACRACGSDRVTRIGMSLTDGSPVELTSCHTCDHRSWEAEGGELLTVSSVLDRARKRA